MKSGKVSKKRINRAKIVIIFLALILNLFACTSTPKREPSTLANMKYLVALGKHEQAIDEMKLALKASPQSTYSPEIAYLIGESQMALNQFGPAEKSYVFLIHEYPKSPYAALGWRRMGELERKRGNFNEAIENYKRSMQVYDAQFNVERCTLLIGRIYEEDFKDLDKALAEYKKLLKELKNPRIASEAFLSASKIYLKQDNKEEARRVLEKLLELYPTSSEAEEAKKLLEPLKG